MTLTSGYGHVIVPRSTQRSAFCGASPKVDWNWTCLIATEPLVSAAPNDVV